MRKISYPAPSRVGITGSPATGKKSIGREIAKISGLKFLSINEYAIERGFGSWMGKEFVVDTKRLKGKIDAENRIVSGHLLSNVIPKRELDFVVVLRCSPNVLTKRYKKRGYPKNKIVENVEAEMIGEIASTALRTYGIHKLAEIDTTRVRNPETIAKRIVDIGRGVKPRSFGKVDWLSHIHSGRALRSALRA